jgi:hypothetical protein
LLRPSQTIAEIIHKTVTEVTAALVPAIQRQVAALAAQELEKRLAVRGAKRSRAAPLRRSRPKEITRWVADRRARRVPTFVIELTGGVDTKKKIVAKSGENAVFEGKAATEASQSCVSDAMLRQPSSRRRARLGVERHVVLPAAHPGQRTPRSPHYTP